MTKAELVSLLANECGITKGKAGQAVDYVVGAIQTTLGGGGRIAIAGLGTFGITNRAARMGRNPQTGQSIHIPARRAPTFKAAKALKNAAS